MTLTIVLVILTLHFISDFLLQTNWMALNKSKSHFALTIHVVVYSLPFLFLFGFIYAITNLVLHFITDFITSRITSKLWAKGMGYLDVGNRNKAGNAFHWFFAVIGLDQLLHAAALLGTYQFLFL